MDILGTKHSTGVTTEGHRISLYQRDGFPIYVRITFSCGSRFDPVGKAGLAHLYEHMVLTGTKTFPSKDKITDELQQYGGGIHASTSKEGININLAVADPIDLPQITKIYKSLFTEQVFDPEVFKNEREVVLVELMNREQKSTITVGDLFQEVCFSNSSLSRNAIGSIESINSVTIDDIADFHKKVISSPANIVISGGVSIDEAEQGFSNIGLQANDAKENSKESAVQIGGKVSIKKTSEQIIQMIFGFRTNSLGSPDFYNLEIASDIIGGGRSSLLMKKLRYEAGLVYGASSSQISFSDVGAWGVSTATPKKNLAKVVGLICEILREIRTNGFSAEQIEKSKNKMLKTKRYSLQSSESWVDLHTNKTNPTNNSDNCYNYIEQIQKTALEGINQIVKKYFVADNWYLALVGDVDEGEVKVNLS